MTHTHLESGDHAVLLIHGLSGNPLEMQYLARRLQATGFSVHVPHMRGYGYRQGAKGAKGASIGHWQDWYAEVAAEFDTLQRAYRSVSVCGLCIGAVLALKLAAERSERICALSLLATTLFYDGWSIPWYRFLLPLGYYTPMGRHYAYEERYPFGVKNARLREWIAREMREKSTSIAGAALLPMAAIHEAAKLIGNVKRIIPRITTPALVMHALEDDVASVRSAEFVENGIRSNVKRSVRLADSYHMLTLDNDKQQVADETIGFFQEAITRRVDTLPHAVRGGNRQPAGVDAAQALALPVRY